MSFQNIIKAIINPRDADVGGGRDHVVSHHCLPAAVFFTNTFQCSYHPPVCHTPPDLVLEYFESGGGNGSEENNPEIDTDFITHRWGSA